MKDKEVMWEYIAVLRREVETLKERLRGVAIKDCPKCGHPVLAQFIIIYSSPYTPGLPQHSYYQCLTCGVKFTCEDKCVCKVVE